MVRWTRRGSPEPEPLLWSISSDSVDVPEHIIRWMECFGSEFIWVGGLGSKQEKLTHKKKKVENLSCLQVLVVFSVEGWRPDTCSGPVTFWYGSPYLRLTDLDLDPASDPALFVNDLQQKIIFFC
jgi:hypothetical protein